MNSKLPPSPKGYGRTSKSTNENYNPSEIEAKWQAIWEKEKIYLVLIKNANNILSRKTVLYLGCQCRHLTKRALYTNIGLYGSFSRESCS